MTHRWKLRKLLVCLVCIIFGERVPNNHTMSPCDHVNVFKYKLDPLNIFEYSRLQGDDGHQNPHILSYCHILLLTQVSTVFTQALQAIPSYQ